METTEIGGLTFQLYQQMATFGKKQGMSQQNCDLKVKIMSPKERCYYPDVPHERKTALRSS